MRFFDAQFQRQIAAQECQLNPFEAAALPHLRGAVLDHGCGLGNLALAAGRQGCSVTALDGSHAAIEHLREAARRDALPVQAIEADLCTHAISSDFDTVVCIGLLMFFDCPTALRQLAQLQAAVRPGGTAVVNVLIEGTTYLDMFAPEGHCLFGPDELRERFAGLGTGEFRAADLRGAAGDGEGLRDDHCAQAGLRCRDWGFGITMVASREKPA